MKLPAIKLKNITAGGLKKIGQKKICSPNNKFILCKLHTGVYETRFAYLKLYGLNARQRESHLNKPY